MRKSEALATILHLQPTNATPSCAARAQDIQNAKDHWLALSNKQKRRPPNAAICVHDGMKKRAQSRAWIDRVRAVSGCWGGAHSFKLRLKIRMPIAASSARKHLPETAKSNERALTAHVRACAGWSTGTGSAHACKQSGG